MKKGFEDWIEIFRTGTHTDSAGHTQTWGDSDLERMVSSYNPEKNEAPIVIGHPETNAPAYGWVEALKKEGARLLMKAKDMVPEFVEMVKQGLFKKRSISIYPDGTLRHVGFLGAAAPAVKGLKDIAFEQDNSVIIEFSSEERPANAGRKNSKEDKPNKQEGKIMGWKDRIKAAFTTAIDDMPDDGVPNVTPTKQFSEEDVKAREKAAADKAAEKAKEDAKKEFAEKQNTERIEKRKGEIKSFVEKLKKDGKLLPAWEKMGLLEFMLNLDGETVIEFAEGKKASASQFMQDFLNELPKVINFDEIATRDKDTGGDNAAEKLEVLTHKKIQDNKDLTYSQAFSEVQKEHPVLAKEYAAEFSQTQR